MYYINMKTAGQVETIDMFETWREANDMLAEYHLAFGYDAHLYLSQRSTKDWREGR